MHYVYHSTPKPTLTLYLHLHTHTHTHTHQTVMYIVMEDETLPKRLSGVGEEGELWIGGIGVAKGYLNAPDLTAKVFLENPFGAGTVYRTGDIVKRLNVSC